jgi:hypothetical protein
MIMAELSFRAVIVCDDVRREDNGKEILIGVYSSHILVSVFPANLRLFFYTMLSADESGDYKFSMRLIGPNGVQLIQGNIDAQMRGPGGEAALPIGPLVIQVQSPGEIVLEIKQAGREDWERIRTIGVSTPEEAPGS